MSLQRKVVFEENNERIKNLEEEIRKLNESKKDEKFIRDTKIDFKKIESEEVKKPEIIEKEKRIKTKKKLRKEFLSKSGLKRKIRSLIEKRKRLDKETFGDIFLDKK